MEKMTDRIFEYINIVFYISLSFVSAIIISIPMVWHENINSAIFWMLIFLIPASIAYYFRKWYILVFFLLLASIQGAMLVTRVHIGGAFFAQIPVLFTIILLLSRKPIEQKKRRTILTVLVVSFPLCVFMIPTIAYYFFLFGFIFHLLKYTLPITSIYSIVFGRKVSNFQFISSIVCIISILAVSGFAFNQESLFESEMQGLEEMVFHPKRDYRPNEGVWKEGDTVIAEKIVYFQGGGNGEGLRWNDVILNYEGLRGSVITTEISSYLRASEFPFKLYRNDERNVVIIYESIYYLDPYYPYKNNYIPPGVWIYEIEGKSVSRRRVISNPLSIYFRQGTIFNWAWDT